VLSTAKADQNSTTTMSGSVAMPKRFVRNTLIILALSSWGTAVLADDYADGFLAASSGDYKVAYTKWRDLAEQGDANAQFNLGLMYHSGLQVPFNEKKAVYWYKRAAEGGNRLAQEYLVVGYREGWFGLKPDQAKAHYWNQRLNGEIDTAAVDYSSGK
jgi:TPR repeat protein